MAGISRTVTFTKLSRWLAVSSTLALALLFVNAAARPALAHEVRPAIANLTLSPDRAEIEILLTLEAIVARLDLTDVQDTNDADGADEYDRLRALPPKELEELFRSIWPEVQSSLTLRAGQQEAELLLDGMEIATVGDPDLPRDSVLRMSASLPPNDFPVVFGWISDYGPLVVRQMGAGDDAYSGYLTNGQLSDPISRTGTVARSWIVTFVDYIRIGFEHIIPKGLDHILFVLGLFFFSLQMRPILYQVTSFTVAHTVALALGILGYVNVPASIVEPLIAASIVYVGVENIMTNQYHMRRTVVVFLFGLLHGLGFASVLGDIGLSAGRFITGLIGFNIGVELGQLAVIAIAFVLVGWWFGSKPWYRARISVPASVLISLIGAYWFVERTFT